MRLRPAAPEMLLNAMPMQVSPAIILDGQPKKTLGKCVRICGTGSQKILTVITDFEYQHSSGILSCVFYFPTNLPPCWWVLCCWRHFCLLKGALRIGSASL